MNLVPPPRPGQSRQARGSNGFYEPLQKRQCLNENNLEQTKTLQHRGHSQSARWHDQQQGQIHPRQSRVTYGQRPIAEDYEQPRYQGPWEPQRQLRNQAQTFSSSPLRQEQPQFEQQLQQHQYETQRFTGSGQFSFRSSQHQHDFPTSQYPDHRSPSPQWQNQQNQGRNSHDINSQPIPKQHTLSLCDNSRIPHWQQRHGQPQFEHHLLQDRQNRDNCGYEPEQRRTQRDQQFWQPMQPGPVQPRPAQHGNELQFQPQRHQNMSQQQHRLRHDHQPTQKQYDSQHRRRRILAAAPFIPLHHISPFMGVWKVRVKVTNKSQVRNWNKGNSSGSFFTFEVHNGSTSMKVTGFNDKCVQFFDKVEEGDLICLAGGDLRPRNTVYNHTSFWFELVLDSTSYIENLDHEPDDIPDLRPSLRRISDIPSLPSNSVVDVIGIVKAASQIKDIVTKNGSTTMKRDFSIVDDSMCEITLTFWGEEARNVNLEENDVIVATRTKVSEFGGRSLSSSFSTRIRVNPATSEAQLLRQWWQRGGGDSFRSLTNLGVGRARLTLSLGEAMRSYHAAIRNPNANVNAAFNCPSSVLFVRQSNYVYRACVSDDCKKKVVEADGRFRCDKCGMVNDSFQWRFMLSLQISDWSQSIWAVSFQETSKILVGAEAAEVGLLKEQGNEQELDHLFRDVQLRKFNFRLRLKEETFGDQRRLRGVCVDVSVFDPVARGTFLDAKIKRLAREI